MTSLFFLGREPRANQSVQESLSRRGIRLLKAQPSEVVPVVGLSDVQPGHHVFVRSLPVYVEAAVSQSALPLNHPWVPLTRPQLPGFVRSPLITWSYSDRVSPDFINTVRSTYKASETVTKGKAAFLARLTGQQIQKLRTTQPTLIMSTPCNPQCINIDAYRQYLFAYKCIDAILRVNQYPYRFEAGHSVGYEVDSRVFTEMTTTELEGLTASAMDPDEINVPFLSHRGKAHCNNPSSHNDFNYLVSSSNQVPAGMEGFHMPYVEELAQPDHQMIPSFFRQYCLGFFGDNKNDALEAYMTFKRDIGVISDTTWGKEMCHILWCLELTLTSQSTMRIMVDPANKYLGCMVLGSGYSFRLGEKHYFPQPRLALVADFAIASPHMAAVHAIATVINFATPLVRSVAVASWTCNNDVRNALVRATISEEGRLTATTNFPCLSFPNEPAPLTITAYNLALVLNHIQNGREDGDSLFHLHSSMILEDNRESRLWSSFGSLSPSFLVPGGKKMELSQPFERTMKGAGGSMEEVPVTKVAVAIKSIRDACADLQKMRVDRAILNPHGSSVMNRVSSDSLIRSFEKEQASAVIGALRAYAGISMVSSSGKRKDRDDEDDIGPSSKKQRLAAYDF